MADFHISFFTFSSEPEEANPQVYEGDLLLTYVTKLFDNPQWRSRLLAGVSTVGLISHGSQFGFSNLYGLALGVRSEYFKDRDSSYSFEFYYAPYEDLSLELDRAFKLKGALNINLTNLRKLILEMSYSNHFFVSGFEEVEMEIIGTTLGLSF